MVKLLVGRAGCIAFFGHDMGSNEVLTQFFLGIYNDCIKAQSSDFLETVTCVAEEVFIKAEYFRLLPESIAA